MITIKIEGLSDVMSALRDLPNSTAKNVMKRVLLARAAPVAEAAETGKRADIEAATEQIERVLRSNRMM
jgi:hypothetical protein